MYNNLLNKTLHIQRRKIKGFRESDNINGSFKITNLEQIIETDFLHFMVICCLIKTENERIVTGTLDGTISICSFNITKKKWLDLLHLHKRKHATAQLSSCIIP